MNIKQALKEKNKLKGKISQSFERIRYYNNVMEGMSKSYDIHEVYKQVEEDIHRLVDIKSRIQLANKEVFTKIYRLSELKNLATLLRRLSCSVTRNTDGGMITYSIPQIGLEERDQLLEKTEAEIESIQEELENFNHVTMI
jgi:ribosome recycling factor